MHYIKKMKNHNLINFLRNQGCTPMPSHAFPILFPCVCSTSMPRSKRTFHWALPCSIMKTERVLLCVFDFYSMNNRQFDGVFQAVHLPLPVGTKAWNNKGRKCSPILFCTIKERYNYIKNKPSASQFCFNCYCSLLHDILVQTLPKLVLVRNLHADF